MPAICPPKCSRNQTPHPRLGRPSTAFAITLSAADRSSPNCTRRNKQVEEVPHAAVHDAASRSAQRSPKRDDDGMQFDWQFVTSVLQILVIDVVLSGDNAVVIAMAAHRLPEKQRRTAIFCGAAGAIVLRVLFTYVLRQLLDVPLLRFGGGLVLVWIAMKLLLDEEEEEGSHKVREASGLIHAIWIIIMADFVMSLDNMLAVGGASEGHATLIVFGLVLSIAIIMTCSVYIA